jgi:hypothetical protein
MHNCEEFREQITEHIIDREDLLAKSEFQQELVRCTDCAEFYAQSREMIQALDGVELSMTESLWTGIEQRLNARIRNVAVAPRTSTRETRFQSRGYMGPAALASAAALLLITVTLSKIAIPGGVPAPGESARAVYVEQSVPLDPVTVDFLQASELLLRNVMKMAPSDVDDLAEAKKAAIEQLVELEQRKDAASAVPPVVDVMETYETVLRDLRNVDERSAGEDISDIQKRIQKNGLIANLKAFQPRVTEVSFDPR